MKGFGPDYTAFLNSGLEDGFEKSEDEIISGALVVLYHRSLESLTKTIVKNRGIISKQIFSFLGEHRFHFVDPSGNELAVWCYK